jgi:tRNA G18 (ribose-2'-O)-methylase SpoU
VAIASLEAITDFDRPDLVPYASMRMHQDHWRERIFVAEGEKVVRRLLESRLEVISVLLPEKWLLNLRDQITARPEPIRCFTASKKLLEQLSGFSMYQGLLAVGRIPPAVTVTEAVANSPSPRLFAAVDGLTQAENLGALVRNCVAFGTQALLVGETCGHPYLRRAVRASMATIFHLPVVESGNLAASLAELRAAGVRCVAAHPHTNRRTLPQSELARDCCIVFGSEGQGIAPAVLAACDEAVSIPMPAHVDSLNVGAAAAVFLYEAQRQRGWLV